MHGYFLSDLHLFSKRSKGHVIEQQIRETADRAHTLVLGGDIFDFKWSTRPSLRHSIDEAIRWVESLIVSYPNCAFYYILGNHDAHPDFVAELDRLAFEQPRLVWQPYVLRLGYCVFLHGDVLDGDSQHETIDARRRKHQEQPLPHRYRHWLYDAAVMARLHRVALHVVKRQVTVLRMLDRYLKEQGLDASSGVTDVYFGHTHREMDGVKYHGLTFHNGGAPLAGLSYRIIKTRLESSS
jgi:UDP-2,3-diacylglucosamine pyrophosphatase LpxH